MVLEAPHTDIPTQTSCTRDPHTEILHKWSYYRILAQRSWKSDTRDPHTEILHKWSYRILMQRSWQRHLAQEILIQRSCTGGPRGSSYRHPDSNILHKRSSYSDLAQVVLLQDLGAEILKERYKRPAYRDLAQVALEAADAEVLTKTSCRSSTTGFWCTDLDTDLASTISNKKTPQHCLGSLAGIILGGLNASSWWLSCVWCFFHDLFNWSLVVLNDGLVVFNRVLWCFWWLYRGFSIGFFPTTSQSSPYSSILSGGRRHMAYLGTWPPGPKRIKEKPRSEGSLWPPLA